MEVYKSPLLTAAEKRNSTILWLLLWTAAGILFYRQFWLGVLGVPFLPVLWKAEQRKKGERRQKELRNQFRDFLTSVSASAAAGKSLRSALCSAGEGMKILYPAEAVICKEAESIRQKLTETNLSEERVLQELAERSGVEEIRIFEQTCTICRRTGGDLERAISKAQRVLTRRIETERAVQSQLAQKKLEMGILLAVPLFLLFFLQMTAPEYMKDLYETSTGRVLMTWALVLLLGAYFWSERMVRRIFAKGG